MRSLLIMVFLVITSPAAASEVHVFHELTLSPDGDRLAAVESSAGEGHGRLVIRHTTDGRPDRVIDPCGRCSYSGLTFSHDGTLAFVARDRSAGSITVMIAGANGTREVGHLTGIAQTLRFSPDGASLALLVTAGATKDAGAIAPSAPQVGEIGEHVDEQRLAIIDLHGASDAPIRLVSPPGRYVYEYDWAPDGTGVVATTAAGNGDANWWTATIDEIASSTGKMRRVASPAMQVRFPRVSPDGKRLAYIGGLMSDYGSPGGDVFTVPISGGSPTNQSTDTRITFTSLSWTSGGMRATAVTGPNSSLVCLKTGTKPLTSWSRQVTLSAGDDHAVFSQDGRFFAAVIEDFAHAPEIYFGPTNGPRPLTHLNISARAEVRARSVRWKNEGRTLYGWLLAPPKLPSGAKAPMIVNVHGGPASVSTPNFILEGGVTATLVHAGYYVFYPNPRGSFGQGEAFVQANRRDFGGGDLRDILAGVDAAERIAPIDDARLGVIGTSYGGFISMWSNTQTARFRAIVASAGVANWISYYGSNGINAWMIPYFGRSAYDDPKPYEDASAIYHMGSARTPTLIYVGERDIEVPSSQSIEYWNALRAKGVATSLVIYPGEGHSIQNADHVTDARRRMLAWFDRYLKAQDSP